MKLVNILGTPVVTEMIENCAAGITMENSDKLLRESDDYVTTIINQSGFRKPSENAPYFNGEMNTLLLTICILCYV